MSFSQQVKNELSEAVFKKNCCRKSYLIGLLFNSVADTHGRYTAEFASKETALRVSELIKQIWSADTVLEVIKKPAKLYYRISFMSKAFDRVINMLSNEPDSTISEDIGFSCPICEQSFIRGVFVSCMKITDPQKSYHLEISISDKNLSRASKLYRFLSVSGFVPKITNRANTSGLYYKNNTTISDLLYFAGAVRTSFDYANTGIEKEIRNNENRATNCVARNIYKSVNASHRHIMAINKLIKSHRIDRLTDELRETAMLRLENSDATLSELALLHNPPISKSGLNHRLDKILKEAELIETDK